MIRASISFLAVFAFTLGVMLRAGAAAERINGPMSAATADVQAYAATIEGSMKSTQMDLIQVEISQQPGCAWTGAAHGCPSTGVLPSRLPFKAAALASKFIKPGDDLLSALAQTSPSPKPPKLLS